MAVVIKNLNFMFIWESLSLNKFAFLCNIELIRLSIGKNESVWGKKLKSFQISVYW